MPNVFPYGTGEEGDENGEQHRQMLRKEREERYRSYEMQPRFSAFVSEEDLRNLAVFEEARKGSVSAAGFVRGIRAVLEAQKK